MSSEARDDYSADIRFGEWLRSQRVRVGLSIDRSAEMAELSAERLKALEMGLSGRGITRAEAGRLGKVYGLEIRELLERATRM
jgi:enoyl-CoA hydratase/carnithine racemase